MIKENKLAKVYEVRNDGEYGTFVLMYQEKYLEVICNTSFGTYAHTWNSPGKSAYDFLIEMPYGTFIYKMSNGKHKVLDNDKQEIQMCEMIDNIAASKEWDENSIEYYKDLVVENVHCGIVTAEEFKSQLVHSELFEELYENEYENIEVIEKDDSQLEGLWNELWIPLIKELKKSKQEEDILI